MFGLKKKEKIPRSRIELYKHPKGGWRYRVKAKNNKIVAAPEASLKQFTYALRRARKEHPGLPAFTVTDEGLVPIPEPEA